MSIAKNKKARFNRRRNRSKNQFIQSSGRPRLCVFRSIKNIEAQIIDDVNGKTLAAASTVDKELKTKVKASKSKIEQSKLVGKTLAERAKKKKISEVVFDRNGFSYHGRIKHLAEAAREGGLKF